MYVKGTVTREYIIKANDEEVEWLIEYLQNPQGEDESNEDYHMRSHWWNHLGSARSAT
jgi:hypothetical protein